MTLEDRQSLVTGYILTKTRREAEFFYKRHKTLWDYNQAESAAMLGLWKAALRFDPNTNNKFWTYAEHKIKFELLTQYRIWNYSRHIVQPKFVTIRAANKYFGKLARIARH